MQDGASGLRVALCKGGCESPSPGWVLASGWFELTLASPEIRGARGNAPVPSAGGVSLCHEDYLPCGTPCVVGPRPRGRRLRLFAPASPSCSLSTTPGTIKQSLFPLRAKVSVPKLKGNGLILLNRLQKIFSVDAVVGPSVPLDVRPGGGCYLRVLFASGFVGLSSPLIFILERERLYGSLSSCRAGFAKPASRRCNAVGLGGFFFLLFLFLSQKPKAGPCCGAAAAAASKRGSWWVLQTPGPGSARGWEGKAGRGWAGDFTTLPGQE